MTSDLSIPFDQQTYIKGTLHSPSQSDTLVIICHGYTDTKDALGIKKLAKFISPRYDVFRFTFSDTVPHLPTQSKNIQTLLDFFIQKYKKVYVVGHSLGGLSTLLSASQIKHCDGFILINPLIDIRKHVSWKYRKILLLGLLSYPFVKKMRENVDFYFKNLRPETITIPTLVIVAKNDNILDPNHGIELYMSLGKIHKDLVIGPGLTHGLDTDENITFIATTIINWIKKQ